MADTKPYLDDTTYDLLNKIVRVGLPALGALYFGLAAIWDLPAAEQVVGTIALITTFFGLVLQISSGRYNADSQGQMVVSEDADGNRKFALQLNKEPEELANMNKLHFKVVNEPDEDEGYLDDLAK